MRGWSVQFRGGSAEMGEWLESVAEFRGGSGELESGGSGRVKSKGVGSRGGSRKQDRGVLNQWCALAHAKFSAMLLNLTLMEELLNQVDSKQADLHAVKQLQTKFLYCLNCYLTCKERLLEKLLLMKLKRR